MRIVTLAVILLTLRVLLAAPASGAETGETKAETKALFPVIKQGRYGFIDRTGKIVIEPRFEGAGGFFEGRARWPKSAGILATSIERGKW